LDMQLIRGIDVDLTRQSIVRNCLTMFKDLNITPLAEGVETLGELSCLMTLGVSLIQGYVFALGQHMIAIQPAVDYILNSL
ncbi:EAL domain-containing protein, partial [Vibrio metschnikovii]|uniref:EAL domain-containing protein n=1 Tax=Vibrio metschnikovii TaxID=28172 RepID=UPI002FCA4A17